MKHTFISAFFLAALAAAPALADEDMRGDGDLAYYEPYALRKNYTAQRNMAYCNATTDCPNSKGVNMPEACAWRIVVLASRSKQVDAADHMSFNYNCGAISREMFPLAIVRARSLFRRIYGANIDMPLPPEPVRR